MLQSCFFLAAGAFGAYSAPAQEAQAREDQARGAVAPAGAAGPSDSAAQKETASPADDAPPKAEKDESALGRQVIRNLAQDQKAMWTSPWRLRLDDAEWLLPLGLAAGGLLATDTEFSKHLSNSKTRLKYSEDFSNYGLGSMAALGGGLYLWGQITHDDHKRETGMLAGEAALDSYAATTALEYALGRERPLANNYQGNFGARGSSMPSDHAALAWSIASVVAHEYPGPLTEILVYGMATGVSVSRITAKQHFPSDVLVGSAIGWFVGQHVYRAHHDPELGGTTWETHAESSDRGEEHRPRRSMGSANVPLDSWVYLVLERLAAEGYVRTSMAGMQPWTRMECARLTEEASERLQQDGEASGVAEEMVASLEREFGYETERLGGGRNMTANLDSIYTRVVSLSGPALADSYHFGQTIAYDFGRPFERGTNGQAGGAVRAAAGPLAIYVRAEFQHAPSAPAASDAVREIIAERDDVPLPLAVPVAEINRPEVLDAYVSLNVDNWQIVAGRQSFSWGPGPGGGLLWSDNAPPVDMVRLVNPEPIELPSFLRFLGPARVDQFIGRLAGRTDHARPWVYGQKISFKPWPCLEIGYGRITTIGGKGGDPFTPENFFLSVFGQVNHKLNSVPGDNDNEMDWTFYVPKVRNYVVLYGEVYAEDDFIAWVSPAKYPFRPGIFITRIPGIPKLDLHIEAANTQTPGLIAANGKGNEGQFVYWDYNYREADTNGGFLTGNTVGRNGQAIQGWLTYWVSPRNSLQFAYKNNFVDPAFIPGGGEWQDYSVRTEWHLRAGLYCKSQVQYEHISHYPLLFSGRQRNLTAAFELGFSPGGTK